MDSQWLNKQFELFPDKTKAGLAEALGLEPPAISKILNGSRQIKAKEYAVMRRYFGLPTFGEAQPKRALITGAQLKPLDHDLRLQEEGGKQPEQAWVIPRHVLQENTDTTPEHIKIFKVEDKLMMPEFFEGEYVLVDMSIDRPSPPGYFIVSDGYSYLLRQCEILALSSPQEVKISATNSDFAPQTLALDEVDVIGRVVAKLHWL